jgi:uncharacterized protein
VIRRRVDWGISLPLEWDADKATRNLAKHGVSFDEAATVFADPLSVTIPDPRHSVGEERLVVLGLSHRGRLLVVVHAEQGAAIRIIGAREATRRERSDDEQGPEGR